jgi:hypothetical protein
MSDLRDKLEKWEEWFFGEDVHSISKQIYSMIWDAAVFLSINEARKYAQKDDNGKLQLNGAVHEFINICFFKTQALSIRRLLDKRKDVISLYRLLDDVQANVDLLTRQSILAAHSYPYDFKANDSESVEPIQKTESKAQEIQRFIDCAHSEGMHKDIDHLAAVAPSQRKPDDYIPEQFFVWLKERLNKCEEIRMYVNKFIAHSATPESRATVGADETKITLGKLLEAHRIICEIAEFLGMKLLNHSLGSVLATPQFDQFEHFEKPWCKEETIRELHKFWYDYDRDTRHWLNWDWQKEFVGYTEKRGSRKAD